MSDEVTEREVTTEELANAGQYALVIEWSPEDDAFVASIPDIPGIHTHGSTRAQAAEAGDQVLALWLSARKKSGQPIPSAKFVARYATHPLPATRDAEHVRWLRQRLDVSQQEFADMLNVSVGTVRSWEQGRRSPDGASLRLLDIAEHQPEVLLGATTLASRQG